MDTYGWLSLLPPLIAIGLALKTRQVFLSLGAGIWLGWTIIGSWNPISGMGQALESIISVFQSPGNTRVILFSALVGSLIALMQRSGGVHGFVDFVIGRKIIQTKKGAGILAWVLGVIIFIESSIKILIVGSVCRPLFDKFKISREKLSYISDSTSAPVCMLIPLNAWGAFVIGLLASQGVARPTRVLLQSIPVNFYAIVAVLTVLFFTLTPFDFGKMRKAERRVRDTGKVLPDGATPMMDEQLTEIEPVDKKHHRARNMIIPILSMSIFMPIALIITGDGNLTQGSGSTAVFWSVLLAIAVASVMYRFQKSISGKEIFDLILKGAGGMISLALLMILAFSLGETCRVLGTGSFIANAVSDSLAPQLAPLIIFLVTAFIAFSTGTSFGTFALMIPLAVPLAENLGVAMPLAVSAVLGGGVFGDHCSPISDTTMVASMASACDHIDHVSTQLPYALVSASIASIFYLLAGFFG